MLESPKITAKDTHTPKVELAKGNGLDVERAHHAAGMTIIAEAHAANRSVKRDGVEPPKDSAKDLLRKFGMILDWQPSQDSAGRNNALLLDGTNQWDEDPEPENMKFLPKLAYKEDSSGRSVAFTAANLPGSAELTIRGIIGKDGPYLCVAFASDARIANPSGGGALIAPEPIWIHETDFMLACGLAAESVVVPGIVDNDARTMVARTLESVKDSAKPLPAVDLVAKAGERSHISVATAESLATNLDAFAQTRTDPNKDKAVAAVVAFRDKISKGIQPDAAELVGIIAEVGEPGIRNQIADLDRKISMEQNGDARAELEKCKKVLADLVDRDPHGQILHFFTDLQSGQMDPELAKKINQKLKTITDPTGFFGMEQGDLQDENSLAHMLFEHVTEGKDPTETAERMAWITKLLKDHGSEIAMMGIFAIFQMMSGIVGSSLDYAKR